MRHVLYGTAHFASWQQNQKKWLTVIRCSCLGLMIIGIFLLLNQQFGSNTQFDPRVAANAVAEPSQAVAATPKSLAATRILSIPKLDLQIPVEAVGLTKTGAMDVPIHSDAAGWFKLGPAPGLPGSAVIDGHNSVKAAGLGVFGRIKELRTGDKVSFQNGAKQFHFTVIRAATYPVDQLPLAEIFSDKTGHYLNLITCAGTWDRVSQSYPLRLVVYTSLDM